MVKNIKEKKIEEQNCKSDVVECGNNKDTATKYKIKYKKLFTILFTVCAIILFPSLISLIETKFYPIIPILLIIIVIIINNIGIIG